MNQSWFTILAQPGPTHTAQRKIMRKAMGTQVVSNYDGVLYQEVEKLLEALTGFSGDPRPLIMR
jgi:cytochrome P450